MYKYGQKAQLYMKIYTDTFIYTNTRLLPVSFGSIDIKESGLDLNVGGTIATTLILLKFVV